MTVVFGRAFVEDERQCADTLRTQPQDTVDDGVPCITFWKSVAVGRKKKRRDISARKTGRRPRQSGPGQHIDYCEKNNDRERADQEHVAHVVARNAGARFGRAFHNTIVLHVRHRLLRGQQRRNNNAACPAAVPEAASSTSANVERAECLCRQRYAVLFS